MTIVTMFDLYSSITYINLSLGLHPSESVGLLDIGQAKMISSAPAPYLLQFSLLPFKLKHAQSIHEDVVLHMCIPPIFY